MSLTEIEYGSLASSEVMNNNFEYLDDKITEVSENLTTTAASINSNIANVNSSVSSLNSSLTSSINSTNTSLSSLKTTVNTLSSKNNAPNYSKAVGISLPYTCTANGYVYAGVNGIDSMRYVYVNGKIVHGHCGYSGGKSVYSGSLFRVTKGDVVTTDSSMGSYYFYPLKS